MKNSRFYFPRHQLFVSVSKFICNKMGNSVPVARGSTAEIPRQLRDRKGRKYLTQSERLRLMNEANVFDIVRQLWLLTLLWTGARVTEALALCPADFDVPEGIVVLNTLKRRRPHVREIPVPPELMSLLDKTFSLSTAQRDPSLRFTRLFPWSRTTAWRIVKQACALAGITGAAATPKAFRHGFGVGTLQSGAPITLVQRWLGHARLSTTAIYTEVIGAEEKEFARRFWALSFDAARSTAPKLKNSRNV